MTAVDDFWLAQLHAQDERLSEAHQSIGALRWERDHIRRLLVALVEAVEPAVEFGWSGEVPRFTRKPETVKHAVRTALREARRALDIMDKVHADDGGVRGPV